MTHSRRHFVRLSALSVGALSVGEAYAVDPKYWDALKTKTRKPVVISTWNHGLTSNKVSWDILKGGGSALDAVEKGVMAVEADPSNRSVGLGGYPDREGRVTLDASIMNHLHQAGGVAFLERIAHPISVARLVMEKTPHVLLVGEGAYAFAIANGFKPKTDVNEAVQKEWREWLKTSKYKPIINIENHDTIGALALDAAGNLSGACTTSGLSYKMRGRVGDSPIIGAGLFVDNEVGAACATGLGEAVLRVAGSAIVVEAMRNGKSPYEACKYAVERIVKTDPAINDVQVGFLALNKQGEHGAYAVRKGFNFALTDQMTHTLIDAAYAIK